MSSETVIELSVEETNALRAKLGLKPLKGVGAATKTTTDSSQNSSISKNASNNNEVLELSVDETNALRAKLGLKPLNNTSSSRTKIQDKPAINEGKVKAEQERVETESLKRQIQENFQSEIFQQSTLANNNDDSTLSWAQRIRKNKSNNKKDTKKNENKREMNENNKNDVQQQGYTEGDLQGLGVSHAMSDFEAGSTTILTLADAPLLEQQQQNEKTSAKQQDSILLENVQMKSNLQAQDNLRKKRQLEMGMGRAGGYMGFDDEEFQELGGVLAPSRRARGTTANVPKENDDKSGAKFVLGGTNNDNNEEGEKEAKSDLFSKQAISLESTNNNNNDASDFMTVEEDRALRAEQEERAKKLTFKKSKKKKDKKKKSKSKRHRSENQDEDETKKSSETTTNDDDENQTNNDSLMNDLEKNAPTISRKRRRRRSDDDDDSDQEKNDKDTATTNRDASARAKIMMENKKRAKYDAIMQKGNERTAAAFQQQEQQQPTSEDKQQEEDNNNDDDDDDAVLQALAKAKRLRRLRQLQQRANDAADARVMQALTNSKQQQQQGESDSNNNGVAFALDETREFTMAIRARNQQQEKDLAIAAAAAPDDNHDQMETTTTTNEKEDEPMDVDEEDNQKQESEIEKDDEKDTPDLATLAKQIKDDDDDNNDIDGNAFASTADIKGVGQGLANVLDMLRQTGEVGSQTAGREEMRGRAKDERTYEDYQPTDLSRIVKLGPNATEKDLELASREIKLDYRDEYGRLLTRKEAFRMLCYQFHGYGSSKKHQEKRLRQIEREQMERGNTAKGKKKKQSLASALQQTQKATGKAFVIHKTT